MFVQFLQSLQLPFYTSLLFPQCRLCVTIGAPMRRGTFLPQSHCKEQQVTSHPCFHWHTNPNDFVYFDSFCFHSSNHKVFFSFIIVIFQYFRKYRYTTSLLYSLHSFVQPWPVRINDHSHVVLSAPRTGQRKTFLFLIPLIILLPTNNNHKSSPRETFTMTDRNCDVHQLNSVSWVLLKILC